MCVDIPLQGDSKSSGARPSLKVNKILVPPSDMHSEHDAIDPDDPVRSTPQPRYNTMLAVLRNTLYMYAPCLFKLYLQYNLFTRLMFFPYNARVATEASSNVDPESTRSTISMHLH